MYLHCRHLNDWIVFFPDHIGPCCIGIDVEAPRMPFNEEKISISNYHKWINELFYLNQAPSGPCRGCRYLVETKDAKIKIQLELVTLSNSYACNAKCSFCDLRKIGESLKPSYKLIESVRYLIDNKLVKNTVIFYWSGGEPTIHPEFSQLFKLISSHGFHQTVLTSGIKYSPELKDGLENNLAKMSLSLDSGTPETYLKFKGQPVFEKIVDNLSRYASNAIAAKNITLKYIMSNQNCANKDIDGFIELCKKLNINNVELSPEIYENKKRVTTSDTIDQMVKFVNKCDFEDVHYIIMYALFTEEYKKMLENRLVKNNNIL